MKETEAQAKLSLKLQAYQYLKTKILNCEYRPNEFLNEQKLCAEMGNISRTPMRDALGRLEQEGLITILPRRADGVGHHRGGRAQHVRDAPAGGALCAAHLRCRHSPGGAGTLCADDARAGRIDDFCKSDDDFHELLMSTLPTSISARPMTASPASTPFTALIRPG